MRQIAGRPGLRRSTVTRWFQRPDQAERIRDRDWQPLPVPPPPQLLRRRDIWQLCTRPCTPTTTGEVEVDLRARLRDRDHGFVHPPSAMRSANLPRRPDWLTDQDLFWLAEPWQRGRR